jgi:hypothetical protein
MNIIEPLLGDLPQTPRVWRTAITTVFFGFSMESLPRTWWIFSWRPPSKLNAVNCWTFSSEAAVEGFLLKLSSEIANNRDIIRIQWDNGIIIWDISWDILAG